MRISIHKDKRAYKRYGTSLPSNVNLVKNSGETIQMMGISCRNISGGGAFFGTSHHVVFGRTVEIDIALPLELNDSRPYINIEGKIVRVGKKGFAVAFSNEQSLTLIGDRRQNNE